MKARERAAARRPPPPPYRGLAGLVVVDDVIIGRLCSLCGEAVPKGRQTWCGQDCVDTWNLAASPDAARAHLVKLLGPTCQGCDGALEPAFYFCELDHVRPLWSLDDEERLELRWWLPFNLQLLGPKCHRAKTAREAGERAALRRRQGRGGQRVGSARRPA